jgi:hypothetical protein
MISYPEHQAIKSNAVLLVLFGTLVGNARLVVFALLNVGVLVLLLELLLELEGVLQVVMVGDATQGGLLIRGWGILLVDLGEVVGMVIDFVR